MYEAGVVYGLMLCLMDGWGRKMDKGLFCWKTCVLL